ncbi:isochorismatase family protein [Alysiella crassa]|uniref:Isochorismatase family n=1 Tax=Alysiella crassa TaxID=153491 RepID=A0A376BK12_9NEIS|nr:isochorismatase family protein [Alysiella crassa]UOP07659.1 isochorismatase family protein [Alysiella crassa]SSY70107.1 Isochorismatase family [Alysiella crassa]
MLQQDNTIALVIDIQERLIPAMNDGADFVSKSCQLIKGLNILNIPTIVTEQYPKGLGNTVAAVQDLTANAPVFEKTQFSALTADVQAAIDDKKPKNIIVLGCETHVCVLQTVLTLREQGLAVYLPQECLASRTLANKNNALQQMQAVGAVVSNVESVLFQLLGDAKNPAFKEISKLIQ